jgi:hypothetical protein
MGFFNHVLIHYYISNLIFLCIFFQALSAGGEYIPPPPDIPVPDPMTQIGEVALNALGEPTFTSLGLGGYWPSGWVQTALEYLHVSLDLPWWSAIVIG